MSKIVPFLFEDNQLIRSIDQDGNPWFVGTDICKALEVKNTSQAFERLDEDEKADICLSDTSLNKTMQDRSFLAVNESGLYSLILSSRKPAAKRFKKWVTSEVLPSIRKTGSYSSGPQPEAHPDFRTEDLKSKFTPLTEEDYREWNDLIKRHLLLQTEVYKSRVRDQYSEQLRDTVCNSIRSTKLSNIAIAEIAQCDKAVVEYYRQEVKRGGEITTLRVGIIVVPEE